MAGPIITNKGVQQTQVNQAQSKLPTAKARLSNDGLASASQNAVVQNKDNKAALGKGTTSLPDHTDPPDAANLVAGFTKRISGGVSKDDDGKYSLEMNSTAMVEQFAGGSGGMDDVSAAETISNAMAGIGELDPQQRDRSQKLLSEAREKLEHLDNKIKQGDTVEHQAVLTLQAGVHSANVSHAEAANAASILKMDKVEGMDPAETPFVKNFAMSAKMIGGQAELVRALATAKDKFALKNEALTISKGAGSFNQVAAGMRGGAGMPGVGGKAPTAE